MATTSLTDTWISCHQPRRDARLRLFCFPYAGGAAQVFRQWQSALPDHVEVCPVQLPGRWSRIREPFYTQMEPLVADAAIAFRPLLEQPFAFFGHSFGALLTFELARHLRRRGDPGPQHLFVAARGAPQCPLGRPPLHDLPDNTFIAAMQRIYQGIPQEVLENRDLLEIVLPAIRADMRVFEEYVYTPELPLDCPISVFGGQDDHIATLTDLSAWQAQTTATFTTKMFPGGHFFLLTATAQLLETLSGALG